MPEYVFKPGLLEEVKPGKVYYGYKLDNLIGAFLYRKKLVTTEDCCNYLLNFANGATINLESIVVEGSYVIGNTTYTGGTMIDVINNINDYITYIGTTAVIVYGAFEDDTFAGIGGVPINGVYELTESNPYGMPEGMLKKRKT